MDPGQSTFGQYSTPTHSEVWKTENGINRTRAHECRGSGPMRTVQSLRYPWGSVELPGDCLTSFHASQLESSSTWILFVSKRGDSRNDLCHDNRDGSSKAKRARSTVAESTLGPGGLEIVIDTQIHANYL
ncbi:hypothetical protein CRG98_030688 [Punica granatum]|uniref:Uncharacterized protein n=1 Tax=Punica granatum TaxID=22663 RepID=A0A2I0IY26_PUNGR|nr:hypothetical protein CRG98_030688 [Punica granatum]